jgi:hypothetical protein
LTRQVLAMLSQIAGVCQQPSRSEIYLLPLKFVFALDSPLL